MNFFFAYNEGKKNNKDQYPYGKYKLDRFTNKR